MAEFKKISETEVIETLQENDNLVLVSDGVVKQVSTDSLTAAELKKISETEIVETREENDTLLLVSNGEVKQIPVEKFAEGGADWNASEDEPGYVANRTHWTEIFFDITWDGDASGYEGIDFVSIMSGSQPRGVMPADAPAAYWMYRVTDEVFDLTGAAVVSSYNDNWDTNEWPENALIREDVAIIDGNSGMPLVASIPNGFIPDVPGGTYFAGDNGYGFGYTTRVYKENVHKIDPKYLLEPIIVYFSSEPQEE